MKKLKLIKKIAGITLIGGGMLTSLPFIMSSCGSGTTTKQYRFDGTNWDGYVSGRLVSSVLDETAKTVEIYKGVDYVINNLTIPDHIYNDKGVAYKVVRIAEGSFQNVLGLKGHLTIPDTVTNIGPGAFNGCHNLDGKLNIGLNVTYIGEHAFENTNFDFQIINGNKYSYGAKWCFGGLKKGTLAIAPNCVGIVGSAFESCMELGNGGDLFIPNSVKFIGHYAFLNCYNFAGTLTIPSSVITIADEGFRGLIALSQIVLEGFDSQPNWTGTTVFSSTGQNVTSPTLTSNGTWAKADALTFLKSNMGLMSKWT